ncbi:MAG TPA: amidohydrolase [Dehalococcoidia bacterium]|nr:amidohydrolase [Dehalococcoidia bacterium]
MIIDFHTHILPPGIRTNRTHYLGQDVCFDILYANPKAKIATAEEIVENMDKEGIDISVVLNIGWSNHELCCETNEYIMEAIARYPDKLIGFCAIQPLAGKKAVRELERCIRGGVRGIGELRCDTQGFDITNKTLMSPITEVAIEHDLVVLTHSSEPVGHVYPGKGAITPDILYRFIQNFPELKVVCAHWGGGLPFYALMPEVAETLSNVYFDTAASPFLYHDTIFKYVAEIAGADKILFGSDYPLIQQNRIVKAIRSLGFSEETKSMILGGNAKRLLSLA